uniref:Putative ovule protein n=1 Tax=Solanum chacoense TaxID=4108 RepID=A0A0V0GXQ7_SOLCH
MSHCYKAHRLWKTSNRRRKNDDTLKYFAHDLEPQKTILFPNAGFHTTPKTKMKKEKQASPSFSCPSFPLLHPTRHSQCASACHEQLCG